jgi:hypothetical protein
VPVPTPVPGPAVIAGGWPYRITFSQSGVGANVTLIADTDGIPVRLFWQDSVGLQVQAGGGIFTLTFVEPTGHSKFAYGTVVLPFSRLVWPAGTWTVAGQPWQGN